MDFLVASYLGMITSIWIFRDDADIQNSLACSFQLLFLE